MNRIISYFPGMDISEAVFIDDLLKEHSDSEIEKFAMMYGSRRRDPQLILILAAVGFVGFAGLQRFVTNQIGMGILYFFTGGLCLIGTIVDLINYKSLALEYNQKVAYEVKAYISMMR